MREVEGRGGGGLGRNGVGLDGAEFRAGVRTGAGAAGLDESRYTAKVENEIRTFSQVLYTRSHKYCSYIHRWRACVETCSCRQVLPEV